MNGNGGAEQGIRVEVGRNDLLVLPKRALRTRRSVAQPEGEHGAPDHEDRSHVDSPCQIHGSPDPKESSPFFLSIHASTGTAWIPLVRLAPAGNADPG